MPDPRYRSDQPGPAYGHGDGAAQRTGYNAGGLGSGGDRAEPGRGAPADVWDAPGVTPSGARTSSATPHLEPEPPAEPSVDAGAAVQVAVGDRREELHFEPDPDQGVRATPLFEAPVAPVEEQSAASETGRVPPMPPGTVSVTAGDESVWDARPREEDEDRP